MVEMMVVAAAGSSEWVHRNDEQHHRHCIYFVTDMISYTVFSLRSCNGLAIRRLRNDRPARSRMCTGGVARYRCSHS